MTRQMCWEDPEVALHLKKHKVQDERQWFTHERHFWGENMVNFNVYFKTVQVDQSEIHLIREIAHINDFPQGINA